MRSKYKIIKDSSVMEPVNEDPADFPKKDKKKPSKYYENHLQKLKGDYLRYCYYDVKLDGRRVYGQRGLILPESLSVELHIKALDDGGLDSNLWVPFARKVLARGGS